ncbi:MAG: alanine--glyoxylate aminotransferase family protein [Clostridiaceae bacterium]|nr:alanine--glyoxylate aminotransferase family protein [Clostridiaceae bacterium]
MLRAEREGGVKVDNLLDRVQSVLLLGPGPSPVAPSTYQALSRPTLGHLDPFFIEIMDEIKANLAIVFGTGNTFTIPISGTGSAGMETAFVNTIEKGDRVLVLANGVFGNRMIDVATRLGAEVDVLNFPWGQPVSIDQAADKLKQNRYKIVAMVHAETSTGVLNPAKEIGDLLRSTDSLYLLDCVTSLCGMPVEVDSWHVDICYAGSQKCLSCPPGIAPITFSDRAMEKITNRASKVPNWYLDMNLLTAYWASASRVYHHTAPINILYGLYQSLYNVLEEGLDKVFRRHQQAHTRLIAGLDAMGWEMLVEEPYRLPMLNTVKVPQGIDEKALRAKLRDQYLIEVGSGLGDLAGKVIRIGLMGYGAKEENVDRLLNAIREILK